MVRSRPAASSPAEVTETYCSTVPVRFQDHLVRADVVHRTIRDGALASNRRAVTASTGKKTDLAFFCGGLPAECSRGAGEARLAQRFSDVLALRGMKVLAMPPGR